jgi:hypothetical protein
MSSIKIKIITSQPLLVVMKLCGTARSICIFFIAGYGRLGKKRNLGQTWTLRVMLFFSHVTCSPALTYIFILSVQLMRRPMYTCVPTYLHTYVHTYISCYVHAYAYAYVCTMMLLFNLLTRKSIVWELPKPYLPRSGSASCPMWNASSGEWTYNCQHRQYLFLST